MVGHSRRSRRFNHIASSQSTKQSHPDVCRVSSFFFFKEIHTGHFELRFPLFFFQPLSRSHCGSSFKVYTVVIHITIIITTIIIIAINIIINLITITITTAIISNVNINDKEQTQDQEQGPELKLESHLAQP